MPSQGANGVTGLSDPKASRTPAPAIVANGLSRVARRGPSRTAYIPSVPPQAASKAGCTLEDAIENIDIGGPAMVRSAAKNWKDRAFYRTLDTMLFRAAEPDQRYRILERFYRLDANLIARFYAGQSTMFDKMRVLSGKPPVPIGKAMTALNSRRA